jgi:DNA-binding IclR family transcriptional regulator
MSLPADVAAATVRAKDDREEGMIKPAQADERERRSGVQVLARAATILRLLAADSSGGLTFSELVARAGLPRTTVHRLRYALEEEGFVCADEDTGRLHLGAGLLELAIASRRDLPTAVSPYLERLARELNETVDLGVLDGAHVLFIAQHPAPQRALMVVSRVGVRFPAFCTASGKVLLAQLPREDLMRLLPSKLETPAQHASVSRAHVLRELEDVRRTGLGYDREEHHLGICGVGVAVTGIDGSQAAISVPMPAARFHADADAVSATLLRVRDEIHIALQGA